MKISSKLIHNFLSYVAHRQIDKQTNKQINAGKNIYLLSEVNNDKMYHYKIYYDTDYFFCLCLHAYLFVYLCFSRCMCIYFSLTCQLFEILTHPFHWPDLMPALYVGKWYGICPIWIGTCSS